MALNVSSKLTVPMARQFSESDFQMTDSQITASDSEIWAQTADLETVDAKEVNELLSEKIARAIRLSWARRKIIALIAGSGILVSIALRSHALEHVYFDGNADAA